MFDGIAPRYDLLNRILSLGMDPSWRRKTVALLDGCGAETILDLATGTGDLALAIARRHPNAQVTGVDPSRGMLTVGQRKIEHLPEGSRIDLVEGDAQALRFEANSFDACTIAFGIRNVPDRRQALAEMARVVRPGGRVLILELVEPQGGLLAPFARFHVHVVVPIVGALLSGASAYRHLRNSVEAFPEPEDFAVTLEEVGVKVRHLHRLGFGACVLFEGEVPA